MLPTSNRIRSMLTDCRTDADVAATLRFHKVRFRYEIVAGSLSVVVPCITGTIRIIRTASRSAPYAIGNMRPEPYAWPTHVGRGYDE